MSATDEARVARAHRAQQYDSNPPRCLTCVYFKRRLLNDEPQEARVRTRKGYRMVMRKPKRQTRVNPMVEKCTFGNFVTKGYAVCDEWHSREGERIEGAMQSTGEPT